MLRSVKLIKTLHAGGRRLKCSIHRLGTGNSNNVLKKSNNLLKQNEILSRASTISSHRNYVTEPEVQERNFYGEVEKRLQEVDERIKTVGRLSKKDIEKVLQSISEHGFLTSAQALLLIRACGEFISGESIKTRKSICDTVWETVKAVGVQLDVSHYNALLLALIENEIDFSPLDYLVDMKQVNITPNRVTFQRLIDQYCNKGDIEGAKKILEHMNEEEISITESMFASLIKGHGQTGNIADAVNNVKIMKQAGIEPSIITYNALLCAHAKNGDMESIRLTLNECKQKDILIGDKDYLDIIYSLSVNNYSEHVDEIIPQLLKGPLFNKEAVQTIHKLMDKMRIDTAYKLLRNLKKSAGFTNEKTDSGYFFIKKLITCGTSTEEILKYCNLIKSEGVNDRVYEYALEVAFVNNLHHLGIPLLEAAKQNGVKIREHYFYPILVNYGRLNNIEAVLDTLKMMINEFNITPRIDTLREFVISYMVEEPLANLSKLEEYDVQYWVAANALVISLLQQLKLSQAADLVLSTSMVYKRKLIEQPLIKAFLHNQSVPTLLDIMHHQYYYAIKQHENTADKTPLDEEELEDAHLQNSFLIKLFESMPIYNRNITEQILTGLEQKGLPISKNVCGKLKEILGVNCTSQISELLDKLSSTDLILQDLPQSKTKSFTTRKMSSKMLTEKIEKLESKGESATTLKFNLLKDYIQNENQEGISSVLKDLEKSDAIFNPNIICSLMSHFLKESNYEQAEHWYRKLKESSPDFKLRKALILHYTVALVKSNRIDEAYDFLKQDSMDEDSERAFLCERLLNVFLKNNDMENMEKFFTLLKSEKYFSTMSKNILSPFIKFYLDNNDMPKALEKFEWACKTYQLTPQKNVLMVKLIENEDPKSLQFVTDLCTEVHGELNALFDLAIAFLNSNRPNQARKILEHPDIRLRETRVMAAAENYAKYGEVEKLEQYISLMKHFYNDIESLYTLLLDCYGSNGQYDNCISLWTRMQEDNIQCTPEFLSKLEKILVQHGQPVPFATSENKSAIFRQFEKLLNENNLVEAENLITKLPQDQEDMLKARLCKSYLENNNFNKALEIALSLRKKDSSDTLTKLLQPILEHLTNENNIEQLKMLEKKLSWNVKRKVNFSKYLNRAYVGAGKWDTYLSEVDSQLMESHFARVNRAFDTETVLLQLEKSPEALETFKSFAEKWSERDFHGPISCIWLHYFLKRSPEADKIFDDYLQKSKFLHTNSAIKLIVHRKLWDLMPVLAEKIVESQVKLIDKKRAFVRMLREIQLSDNPKKIELSHQCLTHAVQVVPVDELRQRFPELKTVIDEGFNSNSNLTSDTLEEESKKCIETSTG